MDTPYRSNIRIVHQSRFHWGDLGLVLFSILSGSLLCAFWLWAFFRAMERGWL